MFNKLEHLNLSSNNIGDEQIKINFKDELPVSERMINGNTNLIYKLRLIYKFVEKNKCMTKLNLSENPISKLYLNNNAYNYQAINGNQNNQIEDYIKVDENNNIVINCFISFFYKIQGELIKNSDNKKVNRNVLDIIFSKEYKNLEH